MTNRTTWKTGLLVALLVVLVGCAAQKAYRDAERDARREDWDRAVLGYSKALALDPGNTRYSVALDRAKLNASADHFEKARRYVAASQWELAVAELQQTLLLNPGNQNAQNELQRAIRELKRAESGPSELEMMKERARLQAMAPPKLDPRSNIKILLNFKDVEIGKIFDAISKASQINFLFDEKVELNKPMTIDIGNVTLEKAMDILMLQTKNFYKVIDEHTILIAPDTRPKRQEYEDNVIRTFFLSNGDTKQVVTLLRSLLQSRQIAENPDLNSVTIKDTPDKVAIAEKIINANDKAKGEVLIDVELLEIKRSIAKTLGIDLSSKTLSLTYRDGQSSVPLNNLDSVKQKGNWSVGVIPSVVLNFLKTDSETRSIAKPQLRVTEGEKAEILIGDRVPIPTTSFNTSQTVGGNIVPITSFTYQNVGITVQIEPRVHHNKEVTLKVSVEVSAVTGFVAGSGGQQQPVIGTRQIQTVIRLRDGETNVLAGLIKRDERDDRSGIPGLIDIPGVNKVLADNKTSRDETDIIMTLTPQIIRMPDINEEDLATLWVGTEDNMRLRGPTSGVFGVTAFGSDGDEQAPVAETGGRGTVSRMVPSAEVEADRSRARSEAVAGGESGGTAVARRRGAAGAAATSGETGSTYVDTSSGGAAGGETATPPEDTGQPPDETSGGSGGAGSETPPGGQPGDEQPPQPTGPAIVRLVPNAASYNVGDTVIVQVVIDNGQNVGSVPFHLRYNRAALEFVPPAIEGDFLNRDGTNTVFLATDTAGGGEIVVGASRMGGATGSDGFGVLATFQFQAVNPGPCGFAFSGASVKDPQARNLPASFLTAQVEVVP